jgi:hypothetical protein
MLELERRPTRRSCGPTVRIQEHLPPHVFVEWYTTHATIGASTDPPPLSFLHKQCADVS